MGDMGRPSVTTGRLETLQEVGLATLRVEAHICIYKQQMNSQCEVPTFLVP